jgi:hypothetical protein
VNEERTGKCLQHYFSYIVAVSFNGGGNRNRNHRPVASQRETLSHNVVDLALIEIRPHNISGDRDLDTDICHPKSFCCAFKTSPLYVYNFSKPSTEHDATFSLFDFALCITSIQTVQSSCCAFLFFLELILF